MYSNVNLSINFFTRKSKVNNKRVNIYVRITVNKQRAEFSLSRSILPKNWDSKKKRAKGRSREIIFLNEYLDQVYGQLLECHRKLRDNFKFITAELIRACYYGKDEEHKTLKDIIRYHNEKMVYLSYRYMD